MAEERHVEPGAAQAAVAAAIAAAGPAGSNHKAWEARVMALVPHAMAMMNEGSRPFELSRQVGAVSGEARLGRRGLDLRADLRERLHERRVACAKTGP